jgi:hypothetical protein
MNTEIGEAGGLRKGLRAYHSAAPNEGDPNGQFALHSAREAACTGMPLVRQTNLDK